MSWQTVDWVLKNSPSKGNKRLVMIVLAERAKADGTEIWPSHSDTAKRANMSRRRVVDAVKALVESGELEKVGLGPKGVVKYRMPMTVTQAHTCDETDTGCDENGASGVTFLTEGCADTSHKPSGEPSVKPSKEPSDDLALKEEKTSSLTDTHLTQQASTGAPDGGGGFEAFWEAYPRQAKEPEARAAYGRRCSIEGRDGIMRRLEAHLRHWQFEEKEDRYLPHPSKFLEGKDYLTIPETPMTEYERGQIQSLAGRLGREECDARRTLAHYPFDPVTYRRCGAEATGDGTEKLDQQQATVLANFKAWLEAEMPERFAHRKAEREFPFDALTESRRAIEAVAA
jgi:hypothetical protein